MGSELRKWNAFLMMKVPSAWLCGVRIKELGEDTCKVVVTHRWINQNPFRSMYFAVQAMAAELSTGALVMKQVRESGRNISFLVKSNNSSFTKKATGKISFTSSDGALIKDAIRKAVETGEGQTVWMQSQGMNQTGEQVSNFNFEWTLKLKQSK